jgi:hypothetical protein
MTLHSMGSLAFVKYNEPVQGRLVQLPQARTCKGPIRAKASRTSIAYPDPRIVDYRRISNHVETAVCRVANL